MKVKDLLGDSYTIPVETNQVIKAMLNKVAKELFYDNHYSQGYEAITSGGVPLGNRINEVFFLEQGEQASMFSPIENNMGNSISNGGVNIQASCVFNENEIKRAVRNDLDLQDIYDRLLKNLRTTLMIKRRGEFFKTLTKFLNDNDIKVEKGNNISDIASITKLGFQVPSTKYNVSNKEIQCFESDIVCITDYKKLGLLMNEHDTPFIEWLKWNSIIEDTLPVNVNGSPVNPDMIMFDRRALKILVNDSQFSYFFDPNSLTYTIIYTENIIIATNTIANVCVLKSEGSNDTLNEINENIKISNTKLTEILNKIPTGNFFSNPVRLENSKDLNEALDPTKYYIINRAKNSPTIYGKMVVLPWSNEVGEITQIYIPDINGAVYIRSYQRGKFKEWYKINTNIVNAVTLEEPIIQDKKKEE